MRMWYKVHPRAKVPNEVMGTKAPNGRGQVVLRPEWPRGKAKEVKAKMEIHVVMTILQNLGEVVSLVG